MRGRPHYGAHSIAADSSELRGKQSTDSGLGEAKRRRLAQIHAAEGRVHRIAVIVARIRFLAVSRTT